MRRFSLGLAALLLAACSSNPPQPSMVTVPALSRCQASYEQLQPQLPDGVYLGWAKADTIDEALRLALADIANQRQISIQSNVTIEQSKDDGVSRRSFNQRIQSASHFVFDDYQLLCQDFKTGESLVRFDDRELVSRVESLLTDYHLDTGWQLTGSPRLLQSDGLHSIKHRDGLQPISIPVRVVRDSAGWVLALDSHRLKLRNEEWRSLFSLPASDNNTLRLSIINEFGQPLPHALHHAEEFRFFLRGTPPGRHYLSLFYINPEGKVLPVRSNQAITTGQQFTLPEAPGIFSAELPEAYDLLIDDYVMILSDKPLQLPSSSWLFSGWNQLFSDTESLGLRLFIQ